ncbi:hypothetical protein [Streptomyces sp. NPDC058394]|uniref:hypothetical protein n=1 Tax=Streptomyces sp. NPDC058394 TaxID=3346477 RepID=UPI0036613EE6
MRQNNLYGIIPFTGAEQELGKDKIKVGRWASSLKADGRNDLEGKIATLLEGWKIGYRYDGKKIKIKPDVPTERRNQKTDLYLSHIAAYDAWVAKGGLANRRGTFPQESQDDELDPSCIQWMHWMRTGGIQNLDKAVTTALEARGFTVDTQEGTTTITTKTHRSADDFIAALDAYMQADPTRHGTLPTRGKDQQTPGPSGPLSPRP